MKFLVLLLFHAGWSLETCHQLLATCERNVLCVQDIQSLKTCAVLYAEDDELCVNIAKRLFHHFNGHCDCCLVRNDSCISLKNHPSALSMCAKTLIEPLLSVGETIPSVEKKEVSFTGEGYLSKFLLAKMDVRYDLHKRGLRKNATRHRRSPMAGQIKKWKNKLIEELQNTKTLSDIPCNMALYEICLKHLSCRQLWNVFRNACAVDSANKCLMTNRDDCWQAFEGLSWTGLGNCTCYNRNSDCHWIRLQTRYNKCVYEISISGDVPSLISFLPRDRLLFENQTIPERFQISSEYYNPQPTQDSRQPSITETERIIEDANEVEVGSLTETESESIGGHTKIREQLSEVPLKPVLQQQTTTTEEPLYSTTIPETSTQKKKPKDAYTQTEDTWINSIIATERHLKEAEASKKQKPSSGITDKIELENAILATTPITAEREFLEKSRISNAYPISKSINVNKTSLEATAVTTPQTVFRTKYQLPFIATSALELALKSSSTSTCVAAHNRCERFETCKWHMSELQIRCTGNCNRQQCAAAVQRFARYVARPSVESLMFCHCDKLDTECLSYQQIFYPPCLYSDKETVSLTCTEAVEKCRLDRQCQHYASAFFHYCPVLDGRCTISELDHCRQAIIAVRGTYLDYPCYCMQSDAFCHRYKAAMLPHSPCIEKAMIEYSSLMSDILPNQSNYQSAPRVVASVTEDDDIGSRELPIRIISPKNVSIARKKPVRIGSWNKSKPLKEYKPKEQQDSAGKTNRGMEKEMRKDEGKLEKIYEMTLEDIESEPPMTDKTKLNSVTGTVYEMSDRKNERLGTSNRSGKGGDGQWKSGTTIDSEEKAPKYGSELGRKDDMKETGGGKSMAEENGNLKIVYASYKLPNKQSSTPKSSKSEQQPIAEPVAQKHLTEDERRDVQVQNQRVSKISAQKQKPNKVSSPRIIGATYSSDTSNETVQKIGLPAVVDRPLIEKSSTGKKDGAEYKKITKGPRLRVSDVTATPLKNYATELPIARGGCTAKDVHGNEVIHHKGSIFRRFHDWAGRCSSWCTCSYEEEMSCSKLPCLTEGNCKAPLTEIEYGERLYVKDRGACTCMGGLFICELPKDFPQLNLGLYLLVGYSIDEVAMLKKSVPKNILERAGFVSGNDYIMHDIGSRLQLALERIMPLNVQCRITLLREFKEGNVIYQLEWFGANRFLNETVKRWHTGRVEKVCSPYVTQLTDAIMRNEAVRYELVLSTVKQIRVYDSLAGLPDRATYSRTSSVLLFTLFILLRFSVT